MATQPDIPQEEIDLGNLFSQIGKMFSSLFNFIGDVFKSLYHYFIILLLFLRKNILILGVATLFGAILGFLLSLNKDPVYTSEMSVETAYENGIRLYSQVDYLNTLISFEDSIMMGKIFDISSTEAASILGFEAQPIDSEKNFYLAYDAYIQNTDSIYTHEFEFEDFSKRMVDTDLRFHKIIVEGFKPRVFVKLNNGIKPLIENEYYKDLKEKKAEELAFEKENIINNLSQIDTLRKRYKETAYLELKQKADKNSGVSFNTTNKAYKGNPDKDLYHISDTLMLKLRELNRLDVENKDILKIQSEFNIGNVKKGFIGKKWMRYGVFAFVLAFLVLLGIQFNKYLNRYKENMGSKT